MIDGIYAAASGGFKQEKRLEVISNNLANVNTTGYKKDVLAFRSYLAPFPNGSADNSANTSAGVNGFKESVVYTGTMELNSDLTQGKLVQTTNPLDIAINGKGFFSIDTKDGLQYSRKGSFRLDANGVLVTQDGNPVLGTGGPITLPRGTDITIDTKGKITVGKGATKTQVGSLKVVNFDDPDKLVKTGSGLFKLTGKDSKEITEDDFSLRQGFIELSNVNSVSEMTKMIETMRSYEAYQKVIQTIDAANGRAVTEVGRIS